MHELITRIQCKGEVTFTVPLDQEVVARVKQFPKQILLLSKLVMLICTVNVHKCTIHLQYINVNAIIPVNI